MYIDLYINLNFLTRLPALTMLLINSHHTTFFLLFFSVPVSPVQTIQNQLSLSIHIFLVFLHLFSLLQLCLYVRFSHSRHGSWSRSPLQTFCCVICDVSVCVTVRTLVVISVHWPNAASALYCCHCTLTWFKFKLACTSVANQMLCLIICGWVLSEIKGL